MFEFMTFIQDSPAGFWYCIVLMALGIWLLAKGGGFLVTGGIGLANQLNIKTVVVGLTIFAFGTSAPELAFNVFAASGGHGEITIGNIFGSNIVNLALVLGIGALVHNAVRKKKGELSGTPIKTEFIKREGKWLLFSTLGISVITAIILFWGNQPDTFLNFNASLGILFFLFFLLFFWHVVVLHRKKARTNTQDTETNNQGDCSLSKAIFLLLGGFALLVLGGKSAEIGAVAGARILGISEMFIGVTIVALATSLPEVVTTIIAAKRNEAELIWGNIVGSNIFNVLFVLPITLFVAHFVGIGYIAIAPDAIEPWIYMGFMMFITVTTWAMMKRGRNITNFKGRLLIVLYAAFLIGVTIWKSMEHVQP
jgi:cation:H+ antiporter